MIQNSKTLVEGLYLYRNLASIFELKLVDRQLNFEWNKFKLDQLDAATKSAIEA